jgi:MFS family permease
MVSLGTLQCTTPLAYLMNRRDESLYVQAYLLVLFRLHQLVACWLCESWHVYVVQTVLWFWTTSYHYRLVHSCIHQVTSGCTVSAYCLGRLLCIPFGLPLFDYVRHSHIMHHLTREDRSRWYHAGCFVTFVVGGGAATCLLTTCYVVCLISLVYTFSAYTTFAWWVCVVYGATYLPRSTLHDTALDTMTHYANPTVHMSYLGVLTLIKDLVPRQNVVPP